MMNGWIKLHQRVIDNVIWQKDRTAWQIFEYLLLEAYRGKPQGTTSTTRLQIERACFINNNTVYNALKRLQTAGMITVSSTGRFSTITICKWHEYQSGHQQTNQQVINKSSTSHQHSYKNIDKDIRNKNIVEVQRTYDLYLKVFNKNENQYKLTDKRKQKLKARLKDCGEDMLARAITNTGNSGFHTGDNDRGWTADLDFIIRSYEQVEKLANKPIDNDKLTIKDVKSEDMVYTI